jgi:hypothetical protein
MMTPAQAKWLQRLRDEGPQPRPRYGAAKCVRLFRKGLIEWAADIPQGDQITPAGLAALEDHEKQQALIALAGDSHD